MNSLKKKINHEYEYQHFPGRLVDQLELLSEAWQICKHQSCSEDTSAEA